MRLLLLVSGNVEAHTERSMSNAEYEMVVRALDAARLKFGLNLIAPDGAAERIRLLINLTLKASETAVLAAAVAMRRDRPRDPEKLPGLESGKT